MSDRGFFAVGLDNPKTAINIGGVLRASDCYGASLVAVSGSRAVRSSTDTSKAYRRIPVLRVGDLRDVIPFDCVPIAIELVPESRSLVDFTHPERAFYVFGAEDNTLGHRVLSWCVHKVMVPTRTCMNLASCVNVVLYDRLSKSLRGPARLP